VEGRYCGTFGDVGLFSLDKGKALPAIEGGLIVSRSDRVAETIAGLARALPVQPRTNTFRHLVKAAAYAAFLNPYLYRVPNSIPRLELGRTRYETDFDITSPSEALAGLAAIMLERLTAFQDARRANADRIRVALDDVTGFTSVSVRKDSEPGYVRFPILIDDASQREHALEALVREGLGASGSYPGALTDIPELLPHRVGRDTPVARSVARRIITLPTHPYVTMKDVSRMAAILRRTVGTAVLVASPSHVH
jgi:dTDP-4-amino-4,6-dideoxygalactose transaminase